MILRNSAICLHFFSILRNKFNKVLLRFPLPFSMVGDRVCKCNVQTVYISSAKPILPNHTTLSVVAADGFGVASRFSYTATDIFPLL